MSIILSFGDIRVGGQCPPKRTSDVRILSRVVSASVENRQVARTLPHRARFECDKKLDLELLAHMPCPYPVIDVVILSMKSYVSAPTEQVDHLVNQRRHWASYSPPDEVDVKVIRKRLGLTQALFASRYGLTLQTLQGLEQGHRKPDPAVRAYLSLIDKAPDTILSILNDGV